MLRAMPPASQTSSTGACSHLAISAVEPSSLVGEVPSKSPITPSINAMSAPRDAWVNVERTASRPIIHPSRLCEGEPAARTW